MIGKHSDNKHNDIFWVCSNTKLPKGSCPYLEIRCIQTKWAWNMCLMLNVFRWALLTLFSRFTGATWKCAPICLAELQFIPVNTPFHFQVSQAYNHSICRILPDQPQEALPSSSNSIDMHVPQANMIGSPDGWVSFLRDICTRILGAK